MNELKKNLPFINKFQVNSKEVEKNDLFFALRGKKYDSHNFLKEAAEKGAFGAVVDKRYKGEDYGLFLHRVEDVLDFLQKLAKNSILKWRKKNKKIIGITGSFGKTTTREFLYSTLVDHFKVSRNEKNYNSQIGLPLTILNMKKKDILILEMGISQKGEMEKLMDIIGYLDIGIITNIGYVHFENFSNILEIFKEKKKIFSKDTKKIINYDMLKYFEKKYFLKKDFVKKNFFTFSIKDKRADYYLKLIKDDIFIYKNKKLKTSFKTFFKNHFLENFLSSYIVSDLLKVEIKKMPNLIFPKMRFEKIKKNGILFILDCYNANEKSTIIALENMPNVKGKKIAVFGKMKGLGKFTKEAHKNVALKANKFIDHLICYKKDCFLLFDEYKKKKCFFSDRKKIVKYLKKIAIPGDAVLIKGSRDLEMEKILENF